MKYVPLYKCYESVANRNIRVFLFCPQRRNIRDK